MFARAYILGFLRPRALIFPACFPSFAPRELVTLEFKATLVRRRFAAGGDWAAPRLSVFSKRVNCCKFD